MKKYLLLFILLIAFGLSACKKSDNTAASAAATQAATDDALIQAYIKTNNIPATKDPSGLYYEVITPGTGAYPTSTSNVTVAYTGKLLDGTVFDSKPSIFFALNGGVIKGWSIGLPHINTGGTILLIIPSALAYGTVGAGTIPANAVITFTITLQGFN
ncbi:MAG TPA: FKBP-type peptidyl-prolyl cis-trans isomerase [Mucilaginibacter sp.]